MLFFVSEVPLYRCAPVVGAHPDCRLLIAPLFRGSSRFGSLIYHTIPGGKLHVSVMNEDEAEAECRCSGHVKNDGIKIWEIAWHVHARFTHYRDRSSLQGYLAQMKTHPP